MADGFQEIIELKDPASINDLNRMLKTLFENVAGDTDTVRIFRGSGSPENVVAAGIGSIYMRTDGAAPSCLYCKESGVNTDTGWIAK